MAQFLGAMFGSWLTYILYIDHYRETKDEDTVRGTFCTGPSIRNFKNNFFSEFIGTFVLVFGVFFIASPNIEIEGLVTENFGLGAVAVIVLKRFTIILVNIHLYDIDLIFIV